MLRRQPSTSTEDEYRKALAVWDIEHGADHHDLTPEQEKRYRLCNRIIDAGLDPKRIAYSRLRVRSGRLTDG